MLKVVDAFMDVYVVNKSSMLCIAARIVIAVFLVC